MVITGKLHRAKRIANKFYFEAKRIIKKFLSVGFPKNAIRNTIEYFNKDKNDYIIPEWLFDERKLIILQLPFSVSNKKFTKSFIKKLVVFTKNKCKFNIVWITMKSRSSFKLKITLKAIGNCSCGENYVSEPVRNVVLRWVEHKDPNEQLEPVKHFK